MAKNTVHTCDRCGAEIKSKGLNIGYFVHGIRRANLFRFRVCYNGNPDGMSYSDVRVELCADCTLKLMNFLGEKHEQNL